MEKLKTGYCAKNNKIVNIVIDYLDASCLEGKQEYIKGVFECNHSFGNCTKCPIWENAPDKIFY